MASAPEQFTNHAPLADLLKRVRRGDKIIPVSGLWGSATAWTAGWTAHTTGRPLLLVTPHPDEADDTRDDLETLLDFSPDLLPQLESLPAEPARDDELAAERLRLCVALAAGGAPGDPPPVLVASIQALMQPVPSAAAIAARSREIATGARLDLPNFLHWLQSSGFERAEQVAVPGDYAHRGGIVDIYANAYSDPVRVELFGDEIESIRLFDAGTQRSSHRVDSVRIPALSVVHTSDHRETTSFLSYLPADALLAFSEPTEIQEIGRTFWQRLGERAGLFPADAVFRRANEFQQLYLQRFTGEEHAIDFAAGSLPQFEAKTADAIKTLAEVARDAHVRVYCENQAEAQRFGELLVEELDTNADAIEPTVGVLHRGFRLPGAVFIPHHELLNRARPRRTIRRIAPARPIDSFFDLSPGDYVVHTLHGIGRFQGLKTLEKRGERDEYLAIEYADEAAIHVPVSQIHLVQKYIGGFRGTPTLSKLGGSAWKRTKDRVADAVTDMAGDLLKIQAERATQPGIAYPHDTNWQREFEGSFPFTETPDQLRGLTEIKQDLTAPRPMDRLICGDVGFGKTELAIRAAFKVVEYGRQVAVLVPTTVLAEQHFQTFRSRLADYPFTVEVLSRFRTTAEQKKIVDRAKQGLVDVLIGTHRLLSADVKFADLGLVVIDEEQRFGVEAKERLKRLRATVDVLTLSATPIPRTLHLSMLGVRDITSLSTPPVDRRAIVTQVRMWDDTLIREAIYRELNRDGQVYFVHNFVRDIHDIANRIRTIVPDARVVVGHGQMSGPELEEVMLAFMRRQADILVSTNIIESGIDIASANTIFINRAERFGLADLHQLRGRVGRSKHRAYAYLLLSPKNPVKDTAARRLKAIEHYSELGAGFQIAMRDLEIRGAGNILGAEQSGHIEAVGYEMYCQLLEQAVKRLKNEPHEPKRQVNLELKTQATIPRAYIRSEKQRMEVYKRLAACLTVGDVDALRTDLRDAFGPIPDEVTMLIDLAEIRVLAGRWGIRAIVLDDPDVIFSIDDLQRVQPLFSDGPGSPRIPDPHTIHWRLPKRYLHVDELIKLLREHLGRDAQERTPERSNAGAAV